MTNFEYAEVKKSEAEKWLSIICFVVAFIYIIRIITNVMEQKSIVASIIGGVCWLSVGVLRLISYIISVKTIKSSYLR